MKRFYNILSAVWQRPLASACAALLISAICLFIVQRPAILSMGRILFDRGADMASELVNPPVFERKYDDVVAANTEQVLELESYLNRLRAPANQTAEIGNFIFSSEAAYEQSSNELRSLLAKNLSFPPPNPAPRSDSPSFVPLGEDARASYYDFSVPVFDGVRARGLFIMPRSVSGLVPLVIAAHGRGGMPGRPNTGKLAQVTRRNRDLAFGALERGYAVWEPMFLFYSQRHPADIRERLVVRAQESGTSLPAIEIAKVIAGLDSLIATKNIDPSRIAMVGMSYGGFYTLYTAALEKRVRVAVVAAYFNDRAAILDSTEPSGYSDWRFPNSLSLFQDPTVAALICPRFLQIQAGDHDQLFPVSGVRQTIPAIQKYYERLNLANRFSYFEFAGRHDFNGEAAYTFIEHAFDASTAEPSIAAPNK